MQMRNKTVIVCFIARIFLSGMVVDGIHHYMNMQMACVFVNGEQDLITVAVVFDSLHTDLIRHMRCDFLNWVKAKNHMP